MLDLFYAQGKMAYQSRQHNQQFNIESYQDKELPGALPVALKSFHHHLTELRFSDAIEKLNNGLAETIGTQPEYYLTLIQLGEKPFPDSEKIIAKGHGRIALRRTGQSDHWQVIIELEEGWHVNAAEVFDDRLVATHVLPNDNLIAVTYPEGHLLSAEFSPDQLNVYSSKINLDIETVTDLRQLNLQVRLQACSNQVCLLPENVEMIAW